jgi:hypothetical protein
MAAIHRALIIKFKLCSAVLLPTGVMIRHYSALGYFWIIGAAAFIG